jgi:hypothetical protein
MNCPKHPHHQLESVSGDYPNGVESLGYRQYETVEGGYCDVCNYVYDWADLENNEPYEIDLARPVKGYLEPRDV